jgi:hypothetical protein
MRIDLIMNNINFISRVRIEVAERKDKLLRALLKANDNSACLMDNIRTNEREISDAYECIQFEIAQAIETLREFEQKVAAEKIAAECDMIS